MESGKPIVSNEQLANDFRTLLQGKISNELIESTVQSLSTQTLAKTEAATAASADPCPSYGASGSVWSMVFYMGCQCTVTNGKTFNGSVWGVSFPGGGALFGDVYLNCPTCSSLDQLYSQTTNFVLTATSVYTAFYFYDKNGNYLGSFQAGSVSTVNGGGAGSGSWS
ncbi:MAG: VapA/VapB family virulence-associated protein [Spirosomataceae bacterium]